MSDLLSRGIDTNPNGTQAAAVTILDKDGHQIDETYPLPVSGTVTAEGGLTDAELRAAAVPTKGVDLSVDSAISGQITVTTAGTEVQGGNVPLTNGVLIKALGANTGKMYVGNDGAGAIASTTGYELSADQVIFVQVDNLNKLWFDSSVNGEKVCWLKA